MVKRCCYGTCNTDSRYKERLLGNVAFHSFPKPLTNLEKCRKWIRLCGRPYHQLNETILRDHSKAKHIYVCSKHFVDGHPTKENPDPKPALTSDYLTSPQRPWKVGDGSEPPRKKRLCHYLEDFNATNVCLTRVRGVEIGAVYQYHVAMLISGEQEDAIREMFKAQNWPCLLNVVSKQTVTDIIECGFSDVFPFPPKNHDTGGMVPFREIKTEVGNVEANEPLTKACQWTSVKQGNDGIEAVGYFREIKTEVLNAEAGDPLTLVQHKGPRFTDVLPFPSECSGSEGVGSCEEIKSELMNVETEHSVTKEHQIISVKHEPSWNSDDEYNGDNAHHDDDKTSDENAMSEVNQNKSASSYIHNIESEKELLRRTSKMNKLKVDESDKIDKSIKSRVKCPFCDLEYPSNLILKEHFIRLHPDKLKDCPLILKRSEKHLPHSVTNMTSSSGYSGQVQLWKFLIELLTDKECTDIIQWIGDEGVFQLNKPEKVAQMWGQRKNKSNMNYESLSRALRTCYNENMIAKVRGKNFVYKFVCDLKMLLGYSAAEINRQVTMCAKKKMQQIRVEQLKCPTITGVYKNIAKQKLVSTHWVQTSLD